MHVTSRSRNCGVASRWLSGAVMTLLCVHPSWGELKAPPKLDRVADASIDLAGPLRAQIDAVVQNWLLQGPDRNPAMLAMFADRDRIPYRNLLPWSGEFAGKYLTASTQILRLTHDKRLEEYVRKFVDRLVALQDSDGYLGPFPNGSRLTGKAPNCDGTWDAWGHYHIMLGLLLWHEQTHDPKTLQCAERIGDLLCDHFLGHGRGVFDMGSPDQNQAVIHSLGPLYEVTGRRRYLNLSEQIVGEFETPGAGDYLRTALAGKEFYATPKPRWESLHAIMGLAELYRITGKDDYRKAFEHIWWSIVKLDRHNNGGFSSGERAVGNPYNPACDRDLLHDRLDRHERRDASDNGQLDRGRRTGAFDAQFRGRVAFSRRQMEYVQYANGRLPGSKHRGHCLSNSPRQRATQLLQRQRGPGIGMISDWALMRQSNTPGAAQSHRLWACNYFCVNVAGNVICLPLACGPRRGSRSD